METTINKPQNKFKCEICEKSFSTNQSKNQHIRNTHGQVKIFTCNVCGRIFGKNQQLTLHQKNYHQQGRRQFNCDSCEKSFTQAGNLKVHIKTLHEGQRYYRCDYCGKSSTTSGNLKDHIQTIHEGKKTTNVITVENPPLHQET